MNESLPNILFIVADDLNSWIGALGRHPDVRTPQIDSLARRGTLFTQAYCSAPYCNASRMSVFTGCLPTTTGIYANESYWDSPRRRKTYVETLKEVGYQTFGAGKVLHGMYDYRRAGVGRHDRAEWISIENRPHLWSRFDTSSFEPLPRTRPLNGLFNFDNFSKVPPAYHHFDWGPLSDDQEANIPDEIVCNSITSFLHDAPKQPFFCAAGLYKPHLPWHVPKRFFDLYNVDRISLPHVRDDDLDDVPSIARGWAESPADHKLIISKDLWRPAIQGYLAAVSYCDWIVGRLINALDSSGLSENTIVVLWGDNGFHLGEKLHWRKFVLWEEATRVPMIIVPPRSLFISEPFYNRPVGLIDLFPTIFELCGIRSQERVDGRSLVPAMRGLGEDVPVTMSWGVGNNSVRFKEWRYTIYSDGEQELYHLPSDPHEWTNLVGDSKFKAVGQALRAHIQCHKV